MNLTDRRYLVIDVAAAADGTVLTTVLEEESVTVTSAHDLSTAVKRLETDSYSCVISLPPEDQRTGGRLFSQLSTRTDDVPLILLVQKGRVPSIDWPTHLEIAHTLRFDPMNPTGVVEPIRNIVADATLDEQVVRHRRLRETIKDAILAVDRGPLPETVYETVCYELVSSGLYHAAWWSEYDEETRTLSPTVAEGIDTRHLAEREVTDGVSDEPIPRTDDGDDVHSTVTLPVHGPSALDGVFTLTTRRSIDDAERDLLTDLQTAVASRNAREDVPSDASATIQPTLEFFSDAFSHELRNHLQRAKSKLDSVEREDVELEEIERTLDRVQELDTAIGLLAKDSLDSGSISVVRLAEVFDSVRDLFFDERDDITLVDSTALRGNRPLVELLAENLIRNAFEHGGPDTRVRVGPLENGFFVEDTGRGIPAERRDVVFERGYTSDGGSGLGLTIVKRIVDLHEWSIAITDGEAGGARFEIETVETKQEVLANDSWGYE